MRQWLALFIGLLGLTAAAAPLPAAEAPKRVYVIPIRQEIDSPLVYVVRRGVKDAMAAKADLIVLDMKTLGGRLDTTQDIIDILGNFKGATVTYVDTQAFSAGSFIAVSTQHIYMAPQSVIGAAAPVTLALGGGTQDLPSTVETKETSAVKAMVRTQAEKNGYRTNVTDAMIDKNTELVVDGKTLKARGDLLTLTDSEGSALYGDPPAPLLSSGTVDSLDDLLKKLGYADAERVNITPTGAEKLGSWINDVGTILLIIGVLGIYLEFKTPGVILPGIIGVLAFLLYFFGGYVAGFSGMEWVLVFIVGLALLISEVFVHPGTILPGVVGLMLIFIALVMAMADVYPGMPALPTMPQLTLPLTNLVIALGVSLILMLALARILPKTSVYRVLVSQGASGETGVVARQKLQTSRVGHQGVAISNLRPGGKAQFGEDIVDVVTQGDMIAKGQKVRIIGSSGAESVVELIG